MQDDTILPHVFHLVNALKKIHIHIFELANCIYQMRELFTCRSSLL